MLDQLATEMMCDADTRPKSHSSLAAVVSTTGRGL